MGKFFITLALAFVSLAAAGQTPAEDYLRQQEQIKKTMLLRQLDSAVYFLDIGEYAIADQKFRYVLSNIRSVPSDLTFYFGKTSYYLAQYKQSVDWLNKYIQLKGTSGQHSRETVELLKKAETELLKEKSKQLEQAAQVLSTDFEIDCGPSGKVVCPVCKGDHVIVKKGAFGDEYKTCPYCNDNGILTCEEYNLLIRGELKRKL